MSSFEYHTITIDTVGQASANAFQVFLQTPLHDVVEAQLCAAHVHTTDHTQHLYVKIDQLDSFFNERAGMLGNSATVGQGDISRVRGAFASLVSSSTGGATAQVAFIYKNHMPEAMTTQYLSPIRSIDRFTVTLLNQNGDTIRNSTTNGDNFFVIRVKCIKQNLY